MPLIRAAAILFLLCHSLAFAKIGGTEWGPGPQPGDVFREYVFAPAKGVISQRNNNPFNIIISDLEGATKAEMCVEYWGGHWGTHDIRLIINDHADQAVHHALPRNTPHDPNCLYRVMLGNSAVTVPLALFKQGANKMEIKWAEDRLCSTGPLFAHSWTYSVMVRIYYNGNKTHPAGRMVYPASNDTLFDNPVLQATAYHPGGKKIKRLDYIGYYTDFDWEGNGFFKQWHYITQKGVLDKNIGSGGAPPHYRRVWTNKWLPDQKGPMRIMARIMDEDGLCFMTQASLNIVMRRSVSVDMLTIRKEDYPGGFGVLGGRVKKTKYYFERNPAGASSGKLLISTWSGIDELKSGTLIRLNGDTIAFGFGRHHNYSFDKFDVPIATLTKGPNDYCDFSITNKGTKGHAAETNWPGPVILLAYPSTTGIRHSATSGNTTGINSLKIVPKGKAAFVTVPRAGSFRVDWLNCLGQSVRTAEGEGPIRNFRVAGTGRAGVYFIRVSSGDHTAVQRTLTVNHPGQ